MTDLLQVQIDEPTDGPQIVSLIGELDIDSHDEIMRRLVSDAGSKVVVDLSRLTFIDANGIGALLAAKQQIEQAGHSMAIREAKGLVRRVFAWCQLDFLLEDA